MTTIVVNMALVNTKNMTTIVVNMAVKGSNRNGQYFDQDKYRKCVSYILIIDQQLKVAYCKHGYLNVNIN